MISFSRVLAVGLPGNVDKSIVVKVGIGEQWLDEASRPVARYSDVRVMTVVVQGWSNEVPLRQDLVVEVFVEP